MKNQLSKEEKWFNSPLGKRLADSAGSPVGVARIEAEKSYAGVGELLQQFINESNQEAWNKIKTKIDYTYEGVDIALSALKEETGFEKEIRERLIQGQKLLFKPNLVGAMCIDPQTHGVALGSTTCTEWPFVAALMRWFHDKMGICYHQMTIGEAATAIAAVSGLFSMINPEGKTITPEAVMEGRSGDFYGGWGFYFVRKYLAESGFDPGDDPMQGYEASVTGSYSPPGLVNNELRVFDLNRIDDDPRKGREIDVPSWVNFKTLTLHKAIIGGDPSDPQDRKEYPGCILINVPRLKVHCQALFTSAIKNLGIGLYPMQFSRGNDGCWEYACPHKDVPGMKGGLPHEVWVPEMDQETCLPRLDSSGKPVLRKTGGLTGTMVDIVKAVQSQDIFMVHIVEAIEAINFNHMPSELATRNPEGLIFAGLDPVAIDLLCARYLFSNVPLAEAMKVPLDDGAGGHFPQSVPVPTVDGKNIITNYGYDNPLSRDNCFAQAEIRGLGKRAYHVIGWDKVADNPLVCLDGHLGQVKDGAFVDVITKILYFDMLKVPWDIQKTAFSYFSANDQLTGSSLKKDFVEALDEDGDGVVSLWETGKKGLQSIMAHQGGYSVSCLATDPLGYLSGGVKVQMKMMKLGDPQTNSRGFDQIKEFSQGTVCMVAYRMSQVEMESPDLFVPGLTWGKGKWPSFQMAQFISMGMSLYGQGFPFQPGFPSLYGSIFVYADLTQKAGKYAGGLLRPPDSEPILRYMSNVQKGEDQPLDFTFYVPTGFDNLAGSLVPNVVATDDPAKILTVQLKGGQEIWGEL